MDTYLFPDTNVALHFPPVADIDWLALANSQSVVLAIAPVLLRELNEKKDAPKNRVLRERAARVLRDFHLRFTSQKSLEIRPGVKLLFIGRDPLIDFSQYRLVRDLNDDWLIASALEMKADNPSAKVAIVSSDFGLQVKTTGHLEVIEMPEALRLPEELDATEKKVQGLEAELRTFKSAAPELKVTFSTGAAFEKLRLNELEPLTPQTKSGQLERARREHPKVAAKDSGLLATTILAVSPFERYNRIIEQYYADLGSYHEKLERVIPWYNATAKVDLTLGNTGGAPGEDIDITVHFPDGFEVLDEDEVPEIPEPPTPPGDPAEEMRKMLEMPLIDMSHLAVRDVRMPKVANVQLLGIKKTNSHEVGFFVSRVKHHTQENLPRIYLHFTSHPSSFRARYRIVAGNFPRPIEGALDFIYEPKAL